MPRAFIFISLFVLLYTAALAHAAPVVTVMKVKGMMCSSCAENVRNVLQKQAGVAEAAVDLKNDMVTITYDNARVTPQQLTEALKKAGYRASFSGR
ncbi:MAG: heavy-metal-associated domain-containing protein [Geobacter sp.]|nr:heavy-metal-associated domain-containing protein [Geobacter sp.]